MENSASTKEPLTRKEAKKASKRKKLEALLRIAALNDKDRQAQQINQTSLVIDEDHKEINNEPEQSSEAILHQSLTKLNVISNVSSDGPSPKRHKPDNSAPDEDAPSSSLEISVSIPPCSNGAYDLQSIFHPFMNRSLPQFPPETHQPSALGTAPSLPLTSTIFQENLAMQAVQQQQYLPHFINGLTPPQFIPTIFNVPAILGNNLRDNTPQCAGCVPIALFPTFCGMVPFESPFPFVLPNPNVRLPNFPLPTNQSNNKPDPPEKSGTTADDDLQKLRKSLKERYRQYRAAPHFQLASAGETASLTLPRDDRIPIFLADVQRLMLRAVLQNNSHIESRCGHFKNISKLTGVKLLLLEGVSLEDIEGNPDISILSENIFPYQMECIMPAAYQGALLEELASVPLSPKDRLNLINKHGSLEAALRHSGQIFRVLRAFFPIKDKPKKTVEVKPEPPETITSDQPGASESYAENKANTQTSALHPNDKFPRTHLLLSAWQMIEEGYPLPIKGKFFQQFAEFSMSRSEYKEVTPNSPMYGLDCEMCFTASKKNELTRISIVNEKLEVVYDTLVMPENKIINYLTEFSGITPAMMRGVKTTLRDVQEKLKEILEPDAILVGQSLNMDLIALQIMHPYVIDSSVIFNLSGERGRKSKLKHLAKAFLKEEIQSDHATGHDPTEDAATALKLVQLKLRKSVEFGDAVLSQLRNIPLGPEFMEDMWSSGEKKNKKASKSNSSGPKDTPDDGVFASVFRYLNRQTVTIIGSSDTIEEYNKYIYVLKYWESQSSKQPKLICPKTMLGLNEIDIIDVAAKSMSQSFSTIAHVKFDQSMSELISSRDKETTARFNSIVDEFNAAAPENSLVIVVLGGNIEGANGAVYFALRKRKFIPTHKIPMRCE